MIVLGEKQNDINVIHVIIGPESDYQFNLSGQSVMDISEYVKNYDAGDKCVIVVNKCESEEQLIQQLQYQQHKMQAMSMLKEFQESVNGDAIPDVKKSNKNDQSKNKIGNKLGIKCPKCLNDNAAIVVNGVVHPCKTCQLIDSKQKSSENAELNTIEDEHLAIIKKNFLKSNSNQKKSLFKFKKNKDDKNDQKGE